MGAHVIFCLAHGSDQAFPALLCLQHVVAGHLERQWMALGEGQDGLLLVTGEGRYGRTVEGDEICCEVVMTLMPNCPQARKANKKSSGNSSVRLSSPSNSSRHSTG